jgi:hypothetical protein
MKVLTVALTGLLLPGGLAGAGQSLPPPPPGQQVQVVLGGQSEVLWPYTADGGTFPGASDPVNLVFLDTDPREVRQALMELDGNRAGYGPLAAFNCTWSDAMGSEQAAWAGTEGWVGGDIQLQCGTFGPVRFHLRLFRQGAYTLGAVHFEFNIPNTAEHQVLLWETPEALVTVDMLRTGALTAAPEPVVLGPPGTFRTIPHQIYNLLLGSPQLRALFQAEGMPVTPQAAPVPIPSNGQATIFAPDIILAPVQAKLTSKLSVNYNVLAPKPFCSTGPADVVLIQSGPVQLELTVHTNPSGHYSRTFDVEGVLNVTPIDPNTGQPAGDTLQAVVSESHSAMLTDNYAETRESLLQTLLGDPVQSRSWSLDVGHSDRYSIAIDCGVPQP